MWRGGWSTLPGGQATPTCPLGSCAPPGTHFLASKLPKEHGKGALGQSFRAHTWDTEVQFREAGQAPGVTQLSCGGASYTPQMSCSKATLLTL